jgi:hypothetical protein
MLPYRLEQGIEKLIPISMDGRKKLEVAGIMQAFE